MVFLVAFALLTLFGRSQTLKEDLRSTYVCWNGKCLSKATLEQDIGNMTSFYSMENCRLLCGKYGILWPLPTIHTQLGSELVAVTPENMKLSADCCGSAVKGYLTQAFSIFLENLRKECGNGRIPFSSVAVDVHILVRELSLELNSTISEEYKLQLSQRKTGLSVEIDAATVYGARHALETLGQLTGRRKDKTQCDVYMMTSALIRDKPVFPHRGILLDTSRNFMPIADIRRTIDGMAASKLNVFHWHATDSHSFPLALSKVPQLAEYGAYSAEETYSEQDIVDLVEYAKLRGVRILMEIDSPAHAGNGWQFGEKEGLGKLVLCRNVVPWRSACVQPPCGQLNPINPNVYKVLQQVYKNLQDLIPSSREMFHMGADEVHLGCWNNTPEIVNYMKKNNYSLSTRGFLRLWANFHNSTLAAWDRAVGHSNTKMIVWTSDLTNPQVIADSFDNKRYIIEAWTDHLDKIPDILLGMGYELIFATTDAWYLDHGFWGNTKFHTWKKVYDTRIPEEIKVLGGEAAVWSELIDSNNLDNRLWPRGSALGERLWSAPSISSAEAEYRLFEMRQRLIRRGLKVDQVTPQWCYLNEGQCDLINL